MEWAKATEPGESQEIRAAMDELLDNISYIEEATTAYLATIQKILYMFDRPA